VFRIRKRKSEISTEILVRTIWVSSFLAMIFALPALGIFLGIYYTTDNLVLGAVLGFGTHFITLIFSEKISKWLVRILS
jgi:Zn-dependent protease with chaperone function